MFKRRKTNPLPAGILLILLSAAALEGMPDPYQDTYSLFWGDLHCHSSLSDGVPLVSPDAELRAARDMMELDFAALSDHTEWFFIDLQTFFEWGVVAYSEATAEWKWSQVVDLCADYYEPGIFVTLAGYEWSSEDGGHRTVYFESSGTDVGLLPLHGLYHALGSQLHKMELSGVPFLFPEIPVTYDRPTPDQLWSSFDETGFGVPGRRVITVPHHPVGPVIVDWAGFRNDDYDRLVEIYSKHGNAEEEGCYHATLEPGHPDWSGGVAEILAEGRPLGIIAGTDSHGHFEFVGRSSHIPAFPGSCFFPEHDWRVSVYGKPFGWRRFGGGLTGVWAVTRDSLSGTLTREGIFSALHTRRTLGTSGPRVDIRFWLDRDGNFLTLEDAILAGEEAVFEPGSPLRFGLKVNLGKTGGDEISRVLFIRNGAVAETITCPPSTRSVELDWLDIKESGIAVYYVRVEINDPLNRDRDSYYDPVSGLQIPEYSERAWSSPIFTSD